MASTARRRDDATSPIELQQLTHCSSMTTTTDLAPLERRVVLKLDFILLPFLSILFLFNSLDKSNVGAAESGDFTRDTGLPASALNTSVAFFFAAFVAVQPIGAALGRRFGMARYVPACMTLWGLCTALHVFVTKEWQLILLRTLVGLLEAGFYPTTVSYLSLFYTRFEFAKRLGMFYGQAAVAGAFGGLLSWVVFREFPSSLPAPDGPPGPPQVAAVSEGWKGWQVLFLVEGLSTMVIAMIGFFWLPHNARSAWFLTEAERQCAELRIQEDHDRAMRGNYEHGTKHRDEVGGAEPVDGSSPRESLDEVEHDRLLTAHQPLAQSFHSTHSITEDSGLSRHDIISAIIDWKVWFLLVCNILSAVPVLAFSIFLPLVIEGLVPNQDGESMAPATANLLTVPPYIAGAIVLWSFTAWSDRYHVRLMPILCGLLILLAGLSATVLLPVSAYKLRYLGLTVLLAGSFVPSPLTVAWLTNNMIEPGKRAIVLGINGWGNLAGVISALIFAPRYRESGYVVPFLITLGCVAVSAVGFAVFRVMLQAVNHRRQSVVGKWELGQGEREAMHGDVHLDGLDARISFWWIMSRRRRRGDERATFTYSL